MLSSLLGTSLGRMSIFIHRKAWVNYKKLELQRQGRETLKLNFNKLKLVSLKGSKDLFGYTPGYTKIKMGLAGL
jgi:hypothetical protein